MDPKDFHFVLSVVDIEGVLRWHLHEVTSNYRQAVLLTRLSQQQVSTAVHKLQEALEVFGHQLKATETAIDLGMYSIEAACGS